jgi:hypothetical protein
MAKATKRPSAATLRPIKVGRSKTRRSNPDGSVTIFVVDTDAYGVIRRSQTTVVPT